MVMPCLYKYYPKTKTKISHLVGDLNLEGDLNLQETCKGGMLEMQKGNTLQKGL